MAWWQFCEKARCFPDTAFSLFSLTELAERYVRWNPGAEPISERDICLMFQGERV